MNATLTCSVAAVSVNVIHTITEKHDPWSTIMAGTILTVLFVALGDVGKVAAAVFLLGSVLTNGVSTVNLLDHLVKGK